jgi:hypothetical protein
MKTDEELMKLIEECLQIGCERLWDKLTPKERKKVFSELVREWIESNY